MDSPVSTVRDLLPGVESGLKEERDLNDDGAFG